MFSNDPCQSGSRIIGSKSFQKEGTYHFDFLFAESHLKEKGRNRLPFDFRCDNTQDICKTIEKWVDPNFLENIESFL